MEFRHQAEMYVIWQIQRLRFACSQEEGEIFDIIDSHRTQDAQEGEREAYYPVSIYCPKCGRDTTKIDSLSDDCTKAEYSCKMQVFFGTF